MTSPALEKALSIIEALVDLAPTKYVRGFDEILRIFRDPHLGPASAVGRTWSFWQATTSANEGVYHTAYALQNIALAYETRDPITAKQQWGEALENLGYAGADENDLSELEKILW
jgi:hypothetical protein